MVSHDLEMFGILYTHLGRIACIHRSWRWRWWTWVDPLKPISLLNALISNRGEADECLRGWYIHIFFLFFPGAWFSSVKHRFWTLVIFSSMMARVPTSGLSLRHWISSVSVTWVVTPWYILSKLHLLYVVWHTRRSFVVSQCRYVWIRSKSSICWRRCHSMKNFCFEVNWPPGWHLIRWSKWRFKHRRVIYQWWVIDFSHPACTWAGTRQVIELCCGMGALGHGASASGFETVVGCDIRPKMLELFSQHSKGKPVLGDICQFTTLKEIYEAHPYSCVLASGIACQPYSQLGDQRGGSDPRAFTLPATLTTAFLLRSILVVIECVGPAQNDPFVQHHIRNFCSKTGFHKTDCVQDLKEIWGSKRNRWWCVLSAPSIGPVDISECSGFPDLGTVGSIVPRLIPWPSQAEDLSWKTWWDGSQLSWDNRDLSRIHFDQGCSVRSSLEVNLSPMYPQVESASVVGLNLCQHLVQVICPKVT